MAIFQLESLINLYFHTQKFLSLFEDTGKKDPLPPSSPLQIPSANSTHKLDERVKSSQVWQQKADLHLCGKNPLMSSYRETTLCKSKF